MTPLERILEYVKTEYGKTWVLQDPNVKAMTRVLLGNIMIRIQIEIDKDDKK